MKTTAETEKLANGNGCHGAWAHLRVQLRRLFGLGLLLLLASCQAPNAEVIAKTMAKPRPVPVQALLTHGPSGLKFVPQVGAMHRRGKSSGVDNRSSMGVLYQHVEADFQGRGTVTYFLRATIFVTPAVIGSPERLRAMVSKDIEKAYPEATHESVSGPHGQADYIVYHRDRSEFQGQLSPSKAAFSAAYSHGVELHAFQHGDFTVLYRFEYAAVKHSEFRKAIVGFMKTFEAQQVEQASAANGPHS